MVMGISGEPRDLMVGAGAAWSDPIVQGQLSPDGFYRLSGVEIARGTPVGFDDLMLRSSSGGHVAPRSAFEDTLLEALQRTPCVVAFSGGRDSSAILAVAVRLADEHGLDRPIAITHSFGGRGSTDETAWQELVIRHIGGVDWHRVPDIGHFDVLGPTATAGLQRYGLLWPALAHCHTPILELARGGSILTGEGGDEVMGPQRSSPVIGTWRRKPRPSRALLAELAAAAGPRPWRRHVIRRAIDHDGAGHWLRPRALEQFTSELAQARLTRPFRWDDAVRGWVGQRTGTLCHNNMSRIATDQDVSYHVPFLDRRFVEAWSRHGGRWGHVTRREAMDVLFSDVLPPEVIARKTKAHFNEVAVDHSSREFIADWRGEGVDPELVDVDALRREWLMDAPHSLSMLMLQSAWLTRHKTTVAGQREHP